jgi:colanic acid biosynthesis glycosyl transferase WcaI
MRVVVWGINYAPEITGIAPHNVALCEFLRGHGADVEMVTTFAYYPAWRKSSQDRHLLFRDDVINGVPVHRCWHFVPARVSAWKRIVHEATFVLTSTLRVLLLERPDAYVIASPPLLLGTAAWFVSKIKRAPFVFHVQDLQPDAAVGLGMLQSGWFTRALYWIEAFAYKHATRVSGISQEILDAFRRKGVPEQKLILFPNSVTLPTDAEIPSGGKFRAKHGFTPDEFLAVYAGNLGVKQGLDLLLDTAELLGSAENIRIVIAGDGAAREALENEAKVRNLANVSMLPLQFGDDYKELLVDADVSLITQQSGSGNAFFPSKLLVTLAYASPVVTVADAESALARVVKDGDFGRNVPPGKPEELANTFRELARDRQRSRRGPSDVDWQPEGLPSGKRGNQLLRDWGQTGREYVKRFEHQRVLGDFFAQLESLTKDRY